jgi:hypothetical protein
MNLKSNTQKKIPKASATKDLFADIAAELLTAGRDGLRLPPAVQSRGEVFELKKAACGESALPPLAPCIEDESDFRRELVALKERMRPFARNHAPIMCQTRHVMDFKVMNWREEQAVDRSDFLSALAGAGQWEEVSIPHYGAPIGPAATLYRTTFTPSAELFAQAAVVLCFDAVDYWCQVYLNGVCVGTHEGIFEPFELNVSDVLREGENTLLVRVENDHTMLGEAFADEFLDGDKIYAATGLGFDDPEHGWHHCPPGMGIWQGVRLEGRQRMVISDVFVRPTPALDAADLEIEICKYGSAGLESVTLEVSVFGRNFEAEVIRGYRYEPGARNERGFGDLDHGTPETEALKMGRGKNRLRLNIKIPQVRVWELETPWLYALQLKLLGQDGSLLDAVEQSFGMRTFVQDETSEPKGRFLFNNREIRLRGANTMGHIDQCVFRGDIEQLEEDILIAKLTNMNFLRLTQHPVQREVYEACDRLGLFLQTDLPIFATIRYNQVLECVRQAGAMERLVRRHPSSVMVSFVNEPFPAARGRPHRFIDREDMERFFTMARLAVQRENPDRVIKNVDGDYDPPTRDGMQDNHCYCGWYIGHGVDLGALHAGAWLPVKPDWHYGCGEFGAEGLDSLAVMQAFYPSNWMPQSLDEPWDPGCIPCAQSEKFHGLWYPTPLTLPEWIEASQDHQNWITRLMTDAFRRKPGMNTFAIHLFIDAWPAGWMKTIMDMKRIPKKAWFTYRDALAPLAVQLRCDRMSGFGGDIIPVELWTVNDLDEEPDGMRVVYAVRQGESVLATGCAALQPQRCSPVWHGDLNVVLPDLSERCVIEVLATLVNSAGDSVHTGRHSLTVFPQTETDTLPVCLTDGSAAVETLLEEMRLNKRTEQPDCADTIVVTDMEFYGANKAVIDAAVEAGARAIFINLPLGQYTIGDKHLEVRRAGMGPRHFVSVAAGHQLCRDFAPMDFKFWHDNRKGHVTPLLDSYLKAPDWKPVLLSSNGGWGRAWGPVSVAVECSQGKGSLHVCQVDLFGRVQTNAVARIFVNRLLQNARKSKVQSALTMPLGR